MTSIELAKSIYQRATKNGKQAWLSAKQNTFMFSLLHKEGILTEKAKKHFLSYILPNGEWRKNLSHEDAIEIGEENIKYVYLVSPPFYIKREGFTSQKIVIFHQST